MKPPSRRVADCEHLLPCLLRNGQYGTRVPPSCRPARSRWRSLHDQPHCRKHEASGREVRLPCRGLPCTCIQLSQPRLGLPQESACDRRQDSRLPCPDIRGAAVAQQGCSGKAGASSAGKGVRREGLLLVCDALQHHLPSQRCDGVQDVEGGAEACKH